MTEFINLGLSHLGGFELQLLECPLALGSILSKNSEALRVFLSRGNTVSLALGRKPDKCFPEGDCFSSCVPLIIMYFGNASFPNDQQHREK